MNAEAAAPRSVHAAIVQVLDEAGVPFVLGMPGGYVGALFAELDGHPRIRAITVRQEAIASIMAEAYGRLRGRPLVVMGQGEWIVGNAGQGLLEAHLGSSPVVVLTEMSESGVFSHLAPYQGGSGDYGAWDIRTALTGVTKRVMVSSHPAQAVQHTQLALKHALTGDPGPVAVVFKEQSLRGDVDAFPPIHGTAGYLPARPTAAPAPQVAAAQQALRAARRPVIIAGNGVRLAQAYDELDAVAVAADAPVATTIAGKGVFPERDERAAGTIGPFGHRYANELVRSADVVLAVGTRLAVSDTGFTRSVLDAASQTLVHIDVEPLHVGWTQPTDLPLIGDAREVLSQLVEGDVAGEREEHAVARVAVARTGAPQPQPERWVEHGPFPPQQVIEALAELWPADAIVTCDAGENRLFMMQWFDAAQRGGYLQPAGGGGMGYAMSAALGAKLAAPDRPVVAVCGDGGFAMGMHALMTSIEHDLPIGVVVLNNRALGWVLHGSSKGSDSARLGAFDHAAIARAIGCDATAVDTVDELRSALVSALKSDIPFVVDVPTTLATSFRDLQAL